MFLFRDYKFDGKKEIRNSLMLISTVGWHKALAICWRCGLRYPLLLKHLTLYLWKLVIFILNKITCNTTALHRYMKDQLLLVVSLDNYKGKRHSSFLPVRGQRTRTNAGTRKALGAKSKRDISLIWS